MAHSYNQTLKYRSDAYVSQPLLFQRGEGTVQVKKLQRKSSLGLKHIFLVFCLLGGFFFSLFKFTIFLMSWEYLTIKTVTINSPQPRVQEEIRSLLQGKRMGNILLLNIGQLQRFLEAHRWVKEARVRKVFPSGLKIDIREREPKALLKKYSFVLIDGEGVELEKLEAREPADFPVFIDSNNFVRDYQEKLRLAWECLDHMEPAQRTEVDLIDLSDFDSLTLQLKDDPTRIILGNSQFSQKIAAYKNWKPQLESQFGTLDYADLRFFDDRIYFKELNPEPGPAGPASVKKEAD
jgi:cell division septal protein FtsQ